MNRLWPRILRAMLGTMILLIVVPPAEATHLTSFRASGSCTNHATGILVDAGRAQTLLPDGFVVLDLGGKALVSTFAEPCVTSVDGEPAVASTLSGIFVFVDPGQSPAGCQVYDWAWGDSEGSDWHQAMTDLGWNSELLPATAVSHTATVFEMSVPSQGAPWSASAVGALAPVPLSLPLIHCHAGARGLIRATFDHAFDGLGSGIGPVTLAPGPLWEALGAESADALPGVAMFRFSWSAVIELVSA